MTTESYIVTCHLCLGSRRWRGKKCIVCGGSGKLWKPDPPVEDEEPSETDEVVYVVKATCDECGERTLKDPTKPHKASTFRDTKRIFCGFCHRGLMTFVLSSERPREGSWR